MSAARRRAGSVARAVAAVVGVLSWLTEASRGSIVPEGYQQDLRPTALTNEAVKIGISMKINGISEVNLEQMSILFEVYFRLGWKDQRINFPRQPVNGTSSGTAKDTKEEKQSMTVSPDLLKKVWVPDVFIRGTRSIDTFSLLQKFQGVIISSDFTIFTSLMMQLKLVCSMSFQMYPFDVQRCTMYVKSYTYTVNELRLHWMPPGLSTDDDLKQQLAGYDFSVKALNGTTCPCPKCVPNVSPCLRVYLVLRRHSFIHVLGSYVPSGLFVLVGWTSFFWPAEVVPGRTVLVITSLLTITSMYTGIRQTSPTTSYVKAIDVWMLMCILLTTLPLLQYALILSWRKKMNEVNVITPKKPSVTPVVSAKSNPMDFASVSVYEVRKRRAELVGRVGLPVCFLLFNLAYWPTFLIPSLQESFD